MNQQIDKPKIYQRITSHQDFTMYLSVFFILLGTLILAKSDTDDIKIMNPYIMNQRLDYSKPTKEARYATRVFLHEWLDSGMYPNQFWDSLSEDKKRYVTKQMKALEGE